MLGDDEKFVDMLAHNVANYFDSVKYLALGSADEIEVLQNKYDDLITLSQLSGEFKGDHLLVLSIEAFLEADVFLSRFEKVNFWFDPTFMINGVEQNLISAIGAISVETLGLKKVLKTSLYQLIYLDSRIAWLILNRL